MIHDTKRTINEMLCLAIDLLINSNKKTPNQTMK